MSSRISSRVVPSAATENACVWPRVKIVEPCVRGATPTSIQMSRISSAARPSGRFLSTAIRRRMMSFSSVSKARCTAARRSASSASAAERLERLLLDALGRVLALELVHDLRRVVERLAEAVLHLGEHRLVDRRRGDLDLLLAGLGAQVVLGLAEALDLGVRDVERVEDLGLGRPRWRRPRPSGSRPRCPRPRGRAGSRGATPRQGSRRSCPRSPARSARRRRASGTGCPRSSARRWRRSSRGCRRGARDPLTSGSRRAASRGSSPWGRAAAAGGRSCARSGWPSRRRGPRA